MAEVAKIGGTNNNWSDVVTNTAKTFGITFFEGADRGLRNAEALLAATAFRMNQSTAKGSCANLSFRPQDVEPLLEQATAILDRALADLGTAQLLGEKYATLGFDIQQFVELDKILQDEVADHKFQVEADVASSQNEAISERIKKLKEALNYRQSLHDALASNPDAIGENAGAISYVRAQYNERHNVESPPYFAEPRKPGDCNNTKIDIERRLTKDQFIWEITNEKYRADAAVADTQAELNAATASAVGSTSQAKWSGKNTVYQAKRADTIRQIWQSKVAMTQAGGLLDFGPRMTVVGKRYRCQFADAYQRLIAVEKGLRQLYKYAPNGGDPLPPRENTNESFDEVLAWTRRVAAWLAWFARRSHNYIRPVSLKAVSGAGWDAGKKAGEWTFTIGNNTLFGDEERHIRIRGISGWSVGKPGPYMLQITPPGDTWNRFEAEKPPFPQVPPQDQHFSQDSRPYRLGRIVSRQTVSAPEVSGLTALYNASPFGTWTVRLSDPPNNAADWPDDFQLDLYLSVLCV